MANNNPSTIGGLQEADEDPECLDHWKSLAQKHWLTSTKAKKVDQKVIRNEIWDVLQGSSFEFRALLALDNLQLLEKYFPREAFRLASAHLLQIFMARSQ